MSDARIRRATEDDLDAIVRLLAADGLHADADLGPPLPVAYREAFEAIDRDPAQLLMVAELERRVVGTFQLSFLRHLLDRGGTVAQVEAVFVAEELRAHGLGTELMRWAIDEARRRGCARVQLTSNKARAAAHRFYERLGFARSHEGFKLVLR